MNVKKTEEQQVITEKKITKNVAKNKDPIEMYIGPSLPNVVKKSTTFNTGSYPEALSSTIKVVPLVAQLIIPISELPKATKEMSIANSRLNIIYQKVEERFKGGK